MELHQLRCFIAVAHYGHFTLAAQSLHLTASPVSRTVRALESELGVELFVRRHHSVGLTDAGERLVAKAKSILAQVDELSAAAAEATPRADEIALGGTHMAPPGALDEVVGRIEAHLPGRSVRITLADPSALCDLLEDSRVDIAVAHLPMRPGMGFRPLATYDLRLAMRADDPLASRSLVGWDDLQGRTMTIATSTPYPSALNDIRRHLENVGLRRFEEIDSTDVSLLAHRIRCRGGVIPTLAPSVGGPWKVFEDPAYAVVPIKGSAPRFALALAWNPARYRADPAFATLVDSITLPADRTTQPL
ncbi:LysR family transcriptional regulator [Nocardia jinanensis]|uniref:LysR family transcriptional regulator n=2 Tax=Nocardia jinanensis TaxID=382504 RepID=A0A917VTW8_9NOCA|nr:LysR family transcriptional regulator [Nocardia jinanensis]